MNSFETDMKRAIGSVGFAAGLILQVLILSISKENSEFFLISIPLVCTLPYTTAWLEDYKRGYLKLYISRCGVRSYIWGKYFSCILSGGLLESAAVYIYMHTDKGKGCELYPVLIFMSGMFWAAVSTTLAAITKSKYIAYGGSFVIFYLLIIIYERYFGKIYCLYPAEWINPTHVWVFERYGIVFMLSGFLVILFCIYDRVLRRCIKGA